jgi:hypothetical protein
MKVGSVFPSGFLRIINGDLAERRAITVFLTSPGLFMIPLIRAFAGPPNVVGNASNVFRKTVMSVSAMVYSVVGSGASRGYPDKTNGRGPKDRRGSSVGI